MAKFNSPRILAVKIPPLDTSRILNIHEMFRRNPGILNFSTIDKWFSKFKIPEFAQLTLS